MSKLLYSATMSLDGFIAGPGGDMSWLTEHLATSTREIDDLMTSIGALLVGKRTFTGDDPNRGTDAEGAFGGRWHGPSVVLTHEPPAGGTDPSVTFAGDLETAVRVAKEAAAGRYVNVLGANVAKQCLEAGLLDEVLVLIAPVLLGDGTRLFEHAGGARIGLVPIDPQRPGPTSLWFRIRGEPVRSLRLSAPAVRPAGSRGGAASRRASSRSRRRP
jgi:dihydrofolate reductase